MKRGMFIAVLLFSAPILLLNPGAAFACACVVGPGPRTDVQVRQDIARAVDDSAAVFAGRVEQVTPLTVTVAVEAVWKGDVPARFVMSSGATANRDGTITVSSCDFYFQEGQRYVVFAYGASLETSRASSCTFTAKLETVSATVAHLDAIAGRRVPKSAVPRPGERYRSAATDAQGQLVIHTTEGRAIVVEKEGEQTAFGEPVVSADGTAVGAQALFANCCTSYDLPLQLVVYSAGLVHRFRGNRLPIFQWHFADGGSRVAFGQEPAHFGCATHYELLEVHSGRLLASADVPQPCGQAPNPESVTIPDWVSLLRAKVRAAR